MPTNKRAPGRRKNAEVKHGCSVCLMETVGYHGAVCPDCQALQPPEMLIVQAATWNFTPAYYGLMTNLLTDNPARQRLLDLQTKFLGASPAVVFDMDKKGASHA